jgi:cell division protein FtsI (penicillin-binding protein 3)
MMLDEPKANASTHGYATAGWVAAPAAGRVIGRVGPMLGLLPDLVDAEAIRQALFIPLQPGRPAGAPRTPPVAAATPEVKPLPGPRQPHPDQPIPAAGVPIPARSAPHDQRHEATVDAPSLVVPAVAVR